MENRSSPLTVPRWLLIMGCPRSGTTLVNVLLNSSKAISISNETNLVHAVECLTSVFRRESKLKERRERHRTSNDIFSYSYIRRFVHGSLTCIPDMLVAMYDSLNREKVPEIIGDKFPTYYREDLSALYSATSFRVIFVIRKPNDVVRSMMFRARSSRENRDNWEFAHTPKAAMLEWVSAIRFADTSEYEKLVVKYEDLLSDAETTTARIAEFLQVDADFDLSLISREAEPWIDGMDAIELEHPFDYISNNWADLSIAEVCSMIPRDFGCI